MAGGFGLAYSLFLTPLFIRMFRRLSWGQFIREDGPQSHFAKRGTPTMGGIIFISGAVIAYLLAKLINGEMPTASAMLVLLMMVGLGLVGFVDDYLKTRRQRSLGLGGWAKILGQVIVAVLFAVLALHFVNKHGLTPASTKISIFRDTSIDFGVAGVIGGLIIFAVWIALITSATSNAVNITDGLDGLATGSAILAFAAFVVMCFWQFNQLCHSSNLVAADAYRCYTVRDPLDLAVVSAAIIGALIGFLWWNTNPAKVIMGDTGSLGIGGALAALAVLSRTEVLLLLIGGLFVIEAGSVIVQRLYFKVTHGKRIFRMSPIHHHFELKGWAEVTVVVRFWIIAGICVSVGVGAFYMEWITFP
jgi:phospho-N-acetylmuramoyl-pentapeptide-transferase